MLGDGNGVRIKWYARTGIPILNMRAVPINITEPSAMVLPCWVLEYRRPDPSVVLHVNLLVSAAPSSSGGYEAHEWYVLALVASKTAPGVPISLKRRKLWYTTYMYDSCEQRTQSGRGQLKLCLVPPRTFTSTANRMRTPAREPHPWITVLAGRCKKWAWFSPTWAYYSFKNFVHTCTW